jgi:hypothetical protein
MKKSMIAFLVAVGVLLVAAAAFVITASLSLRALL